MDDATAQAKVAQLPLLEHLEDAGKNDVAKAFIDVSDRLVYDDGETLIHEGYLSFDTGYVIVEGTVVVEVPDEDEIELKAPALLGEMSQFRAGDRRTATVRAKGETRALQFFWDDLYAHAEEALDEKAQLAFRMSIERQVWERFPYTNITTLAMFNDLSEDLKIQVCMPFPSISERQTLGGVDTLFSQSGRCHSMGYLIVEGSVKLFRQDQPEKTVAAPGILGIFPGKTEKDTYWSATAMANGEAEILCFSWKTYTRQLVQRLPREERKKFAASIANNKSKHFWH